MAVTAATIEEIAGPGQGVANGRPRWQTWTLNAIGVVLVILAVVAVTTVYVGSEHTLYTWDFHEYTTRLEQTYATATDSPLTALVQVYLSTAQEYNLIPTIPLLPLRAILGASRLAYELNAALVFVVPFVLSVGWIGSRTLPGSRTVAFWVTSAICLALPFTWVSTFRGFVDIGSAALVALAIGLYVGDVRLTRLWRPLAIGVLLGMAFLFRRPFAYDGVAVGLTIVLFAVVRAAVEARTDRGAAIRSLGRDALRIVLIGIGGLVFLVAFGHRMLGRLLLNDYGALYAGYEQGAASVLGWLGAGFGLLILAMTVAGYVAARRWGSRAEPLTFVGVYGLALVAIWALVVGQEDEHYAAHFVAVVAVGLASFGYLLWSLADRAAGRRLAAAAVAAFGGLLLVNMAFGLSNVAPTQGSIARALLAGPRPPLVRTDYDVMTGMAADLRRIAGTDHPILVNGSTDNFSDDTVVIADQVGRGDAAPLFVLTSPHVDSRDTYPLAVLVGADVVVIPDPLPLPLPPDQQGVQRAVHDLFSSPSSFASAFQERADRYTLADGTTVRVFERARPTTVDEAVAALQLIRDYTPKVPGELLPWVSVGGLPHRLTDESGVPPSVIEAGREEDGEWGSNALIYLGADGGTSIGGTAEFLDRTCGGLAIVISSVDGTLADGATRRFELRPAGEPTFLINSLGPDAGDLLIQSEPLDPSRPCAAQITLDAAAGDSATARDLLREDAGSGNP